MDDIVQQEKCVCLSSPGEITENPCTLDISTENIANNNIAVRILYVVSQCRLIELFGHHGEYINTFHGDLFDEFEGTCVYVTKIKLNSPLTTLSVKFTKLKEHELWIYGIYLTKINLTRRSSQPSSNPPTLGPSLAINMLSQHPSLMQLQNCLPSSSNQENSNLSLLLAQFLGSSDVSPSNISTGNVSSANISSDCFEKDALSKQQEKSETNRLKGIAATFEKGLEKLETKILDHVNSRFDLMEKKQSLILNKLEMILNSQRESISEDIEEKQKIDNDEDILVEKFNGNCKLKERMSNEFEKMGLESQENG